MNTVSENSHDNLPDDPQEFLVQVLGCAVEALPTLPVVAFQILELAKDESSSAQDLARVIGRDPALTAQLLKIANSPAFGLIGEVSTISRAVVLLGFEEVRSLALGLMIFDTAFGSKRRSRHRAQLWTHSLIVGLLTEILAKEDFRLGSGFYVYGLIHDIGKVALDAYLPQIFGAILDEMESGRLTWPQAEKKVMGVDHALLGRALLSYWQLPEAMTAAVGRHHQPWLAQEHRDVAGVVFLADIFARMLGYFPFAPKVQEEVTNLFSLRAVSLVTERQWNLESGLL
ncbi:MAG: HDOD domain-containing protein [Deltaproteobacteria bacterium]|nr:HDOD domain-containing protein [Deltaproteobacteria bacterium]